jgi:hypothetical protein
MKNWEKNPYFDKLGGNPRWFPYQHHREFCINTEFHVLCRRKSQENFNICTQQHGKYTRKFHVSGINRENPRESSTFYAATRVTEEVVPLLVLHCKRKSRMGFHFGTRTRKKSKRELFTTIQSIDMFRFSVKWSIFNLQRREYIYFFRHTP